MGDIVEDNTLKFGRGVVTEVDPDYIATAVEVQFDDISTPQAYTADGRFYIGKPVTLTLVGRPFTFEVGDYVADSSTVEYGIGQIHSLLDMKPYSILVHFPRSEGGYKCCHYTPDGRYHEEEDPTLILIRRDK